jgi:hypothetical protein
MLMRLDCPLSTISDHHVLGEGFDSTLIRGTHMPVEEPSTASIAAIKSCTASVETIIHPEFQQLHVLIDVELPEA